MHRLPNERFICIHDAAGVDVNAEVNSLTVTQRVLLPVRFGVWGSGFGVQGLGFRVWGLGFKVKALGYSV